jgi:ketosteroid isomerase-like protein
MANEKNIQTVQQVYADFGKQNVEGVLNAFTDDVIWNDGNKPEIPYSKIRNGKEETLSFFMELGSTLAFTEFTPQEFYADNDAVLVKGSFAGKAIATEKSFASEWVHIWKFRGNKIISFQAFNDTAGMIEALK